MTQRDMTTGVRRMGQKNAVNFLVVEDDAVDVKILRRGLHGIGSTGDIVHKDSCEEALDFLRKIQDCEDTFRPFVVLLDINLRGMNGIDFLRKLRQMPGALSIYVIVFTTSTYQKDINAAYDAGANAYVTKPTFSDDLKHTLSTLLGYLDILQLASMTR